MPRPHNVESVFNHKFLCMYDMKMTGTKKMKIEPRPLMEEIMFMEILVRLPVKSLARFQSVCKAWRAIINDPKFIRAHLRHSASKCEQDPCLLIIPHTLDSVIPDEGWPTTFSNHFSFYQWQLQPTPNNSKNNNVATFLDAKSFSHQFRSLRYVTHCDGLVFAPTNTSLYLFNPATRDAITLPDSPRNNLRAGGRTRCYCAGLGLDPRTGKYKVVQAFYRSLDPVTRKGTNMGMEVFTVAGDGRWREISSDPPYPAKKFQTAVAVSGFMFWRLADRHMECEVSGILYLSLEEEEFGIAGLPYALGPDDEFMLDVLRHGRDLCLTASDSERRILSIWTVPIADEGLNTMWEWRYSILFPGLCHTLAIPPPGDDDDTGIILWQGKTIYGYDFDNWERKILCDVRRLRYQRARKLKNAFVFSVKPFTESLVRVQLRANEIKKAQISSWALL